MLSNYVKVIALILLLASKINSTKWLIDNPGFDNPQSWISEYLPCSLEDIVFPEIYSAVLPLPKQVDIHGFILPRDGAVLLNHDATINLGSDRNDRSCENGRSRKAYLKTPVTRKWFDPDSWRLTAATKENTATPDMEGVPCANESIIIQSNGPLSIDLENVPYLRMGQLSLAGSLISKDYLENLINTDIGQILFKNSLGVSIQYYRNDICGCHQDYSAFVEPICHNVVETCERPHCLIPITPFESCCAICGSVLKFSVEHCNDGNFHKLLKAISTAIKDQDLINDLDYHVNYINLPSTGNLLQAIIVDRDSYSEKSVSFVNRLNTTTDWTKVFAGPHRLEMQYSGRPYNPNITFGSILLIIVCLMLVSVVALVIFAHYAPDNPHLNRIPQWTYDPRLWRAFLLRSSFVFARFDNALPGGGGGGGDGLDGDMQENIIMGYDAESGEVRERAFDNPLFGEKSQSSNVIKIEQKQKMTVKPSEEKKLDNDTLMDSLECIEEQELTEIKLESSTDDSEDENETVE